MEAVFSERDMPITDIAVRFYDDECDDIYNHFIRATAVTVAYYDDALQVLVVDQQCELSRPELKSSLIWQMPPRRTLETHATQSQAIRRAVELADEYEDRLSKTVCDDDRTDEEVKTIGRAVAGIFALMT